MKWRGRGHPTSPRRQEAESLAHVRAEMMGFIADEGQQRASARRRETFRVVFEQAHAHPSQWD